MIDIKKRLEEEIRTLDYELKVTLPKEILKAREHGDLRENAEFKAAKERQSYRQPGSRLDQVAGRADCLNSAPSPSVRRLARFWTPSGRRPTKPRGVVGFTAGVEGADTRRITGQVKDRLLVDWKSRFLVVAYIHTASGGVPTSAHTYSDVAGGWVRLLPSGPIRYSCSSPTKMECSSSTCRWLERQAAT